MKCFPMFFCCTELSWWSEIQSMQTVEQNYEEVAGISASDCLAVVF